MFLLHCPTCDRQTLLGADEVDAVYNLAPGMISVSGTCPHGHPAVLLTGEAFTPKADPRTWQRPSPWVRAARQQRRWWSRLWASSQVPRVFY